MIIIIQYTCICLIGKRVKYKIKIKMDKLFCARALGMLVSHISLKASEATVYVSTDHLKSRL